MKGAITKLQSAFVDDRDVIIATIEIRVVSNTGLANKPYIGMCTLTQDEE
jgi:hypothetical protein